MWSTGNPENGCYRQQPPSWLRQSVLSHESMLGLKEHELCYGSEKENAWRYAVQPRASIMGSTPGSFARTRLIFMPERRWCRALRILHLARRPAIYLGMLKTDQPGLHVYANESCLIRQYPKTLKAALLIGTRRQILTTTVIMPNEVRLGRLPQSKTPHLSAHEISHCSLNHGRGVASRSCRDPGHVWAPSDCIPDLPHSPSLPPFTTMQMACPSPVRTSPGRLSLKHLSRAASLAFAHSTWLHARATYPVQSAA